MELGSIQIPKIGVNWGFVEGVQLSDLAIGLRAIICQRLVRNKEGQLVPAVEILLNTSLIAELIKNEHPQIVASVLVYLERDHAAGVVAQLPDSLRNDVMLRIATLEGVQPSAMVTIEANKRLGIKG